MATKKAEAAPPDPAAEITARLVWNGPRDVVVRPEGIEVKVGESVELRRTNAEVAAMLALGTWKEAS